MVAPPDRYDRLAGSYDRRLGLGRLLHRRAIEALDVRPGATVLDVGCGTGLTFAALRGRIGPGGRIIGIERSGEMAELARRRVRAAGWRNVTVIEAAAETAEIDARCDRALFVLTHDVLQSPGALDNVLAGVRGGGRVVSAGSKRPPKLLAPLGLYVSLKARRYVSNMDGFDRPWGHLGSRLEDLHVRSVFAGSAYVAVGSRPRSP